MEHWGRSANKAGSNAQRKGGPGALGKPLQQRYSLEAVRTCVTRPAVGNCQAIASREMWGPPSWRRQRPMNKRTPSRTATQHPQPEFSVLFATGGALLRFTPASGDIAKASNCPLKMDGLRGRATASSRHAFALLPVLRAFP